MSNGRCLRTAKQVRTRFGGVSDMTLWRWLQDKSLGFPQPIIINGRRYFDEEALEAWERARPTRQEAA